MSGRSNVISRSPGHTQVGSNAAKILFGLALLAAGQNATITGTLAGQVDAAPWS